MQAYKYTELYNKQVQEESSAAFLKECFTEETYKNILQAHPVTLYTPNYFIRIALGLLTVVTLLFVCFLVFLVSDTNYKDLIGIFIFMAILSYLALEFFVRQQRYYNAGIDNVLMVAVIISISCAIANHEHFPALAISQVMVVFCGWLCVRFTDTFMALLTYIALYAFVFLLYLELGAIAKATAPFVMLLFSVAVFMMMQRFLRKEQLRVYRICCQAVQYLSVVSAYFSINYMVVKEGSNEMFNLHLSLQDPIPLNGLFWFLTGILPLVITGYGVQTKSRAFIIIGFLLAAATCCTIRYYYHLMPYEIALILAGAVLLLTGYLLLHYLKMPRHGFVASAGHGPDRKKLLDAEAALLVQLFGKGHAPAENNTSFGGGSSGGGGASGNY
jgi:hypothetical protein